MPDFQIEQETVSFWLKVRPLSARERLAYDSNWELRLELHAPPTEGEANEACVYFFARALRLPQACVAIISGRRARRKLIRITGRSAEETIAGVKALASRGQDARWAGPVSL
jgi:uncharacterized protein (TIGR00251 family)